MEQLITKLVADFENGKIDRRDLIRCLGVAVTAACGSTGNATAQGKGLQATGISHISYQVADYAKTRDFYAELLGMTVSGDNGKQCLLSFGDIRLLPRTRTENTPRIDHIAYTISNWDMTGVETELKRRGLQTRKDNGLNEESFHVVDPDGFDVQISSGPLSQSKAR